MPAMRPVLLCFLLLAIPAYARIGETVQEIQTRYGKALKGVKAEYPATVAGIYEKNGFSIIVGFYQNKSYYEQFKKIDLTKKAPALPIDQLEQETLLKANCSGCNWTGHVTGKEGFGGFSLGKHETVYDRSDGLAKATYNDKTMTLVIRSVMVENQDEENKKKREADEKKRQQEGLKDF